MACIAKLSMNSQVPFGLASSSATRLSACKYSPANPGQVPSFGKKLHVQAPNRHMSQRVLRRSMPIAKAQPVKTATSDAPKTSNKNKSSSNPSWLDLKGANNWDDSPSKPDKISEDLRKEIIKYGEMAQLTYDSVDLYAWSRYRDQNRFSKEHLFGDHLHTESFFEELPGQGYEAVAYIYASESAPVISALRDKSKGQDVPENVWFGYIAYSQTKKDIVVAWRGTLQPAEWVADAEVELTSYSPYKENETNTDAESVGDPLTKAWFAALAFVGAGVWGSLSAAVIAVVLYVIFWVVRSDGFAGTVLNTAFAAIASLPVNKKIAEIEKKDPVSVPLGLGELGLGTFVLRYTLAVTAITIGLNWVTDPDSIWKVDGVVFALGVLLPTATTAAMEAWKAAGEGVMVHDGFYELYKTAPAHKKKDSAGTDSNGAEIKGTDTSGTERRSPREVVHDTLKHLIRDNDVRTISVTGHSLGAAMAVLSAYDIVASDTTGTLPPVGCFAYEAPRVGNPKFVESFKEKVTAKKLVAVRVVNKPDIVTQVPKAFFLQNVYYIIAAAILQSDKAVEIVNRVEELGYKLGLPSAFQHVEALELVSDSRTVDYLRKAPRTDLGNLIGNFHNLEVNLHLVSGYGTGDSNGVQFFTRDFALCNKSADAIDSRAGIAPGWFTSKIVTVDPAKPEGGAEGALIEPYDKDLDPPSGKDQERTIGEGPITADTKQCEPLRSDYLKFYDQIESSPGSWASFKTLLIGKLEQDTKDVAKRD